MTNSPRLSYCSPTIYGFESIIFILGYIVSHCSPTISFLARAYIGLALRLALRARLGVGADGALDATPVDGVALAAI